MRTIRRPPQAGFSMVELMVALLLGVVLTSGVISVFITSKTSYSLNNAVGQVEEAGRYAFSTLQSIVSQAGYTGCGSYTLGSSETGDLQNPTSSSAVYEFRYAVYGYEYTGTGSGNTVKDTNKGVPVLDGTAADWTPNLTSDVVTAIGALTVKNSDILLVHEELGNPGVLVSQTGGNAPTLSYYASTTTPGLSAGDLAVASNCNDFTPFQISGSTWASGGGSGTLQTATGGNPGNAGTWLTSYGGDSQVGQLQTYVFFVGKGIDGGYSLYEASLTADSGSASKNGLLTNVREIVPGVENMQILYGVDTNMSSDIDHVPSYYQTAAQIGTCPSAPTIVNCPWDQVVSVRIALIVRSDDDSIPKEQTPTAATSTQMLGVGFSDSVNYYPAVDRRIHRYFVETISLRNSLK